MDIKTVEDEIMLSDGRIVKIEVNNNEEKKEKEFVKVNKIPNIWGSSAGAGSDYFSLYRKQRTEEIERNELMDKQWKEYIENRLFQNKRRAKIEYIKEKSLKKRNKRLIKKNKLKELRKNKNKIKIEKYEEKDKNKDNDSENFDNLNFENEEKKKNNNENMIDINKIYVDVENTNKINEQTDIKNEQNNENEILNKNNEESIPTINTNNFLVIKEDEIF